MSRPRVRLHTRTLARLYGVQTWYVDFQGQRRYASERALLATLRALGAAIDTPRDIDTAAHARREELAGAGMDPVIVAWDGRLRSIDLRQPRVLRGPLQLQLSLETGEVRSRRADAVPLPEPGIDSAPACARIALNETLPLGYHHLEIDSAAGTFRALIIAAPRHAHVETGRHWGVFAPLYALRSAGDWGVGDFADLDRLGTWAGALGARFVSTLPLLATFLDAPFDPSPYAPVSRHFWNELFVDLSAVDAVPRTPPPELQAELTAARAAELVDYRRVAALKRRVLADAARAFFARGLGASPEFVRFRGEHPLVEDYARFRAVGERLRAGWPEWPERIRSGNIRPGDFAEEDAHYHLFAQFEADRQLARITARLRDSAVRLYLDLPLGVHGSGFDIWRAPHLFALGASAGAPPDALFGGGQDWGFPPLRPQALRDDGYAYLIAALRHHLRLAGLLRLDHVMALRRLYWVPAGIPARDGVYVRYPADEWLAVLTLESRRHAATIIGEDLGTVPPAVRAAMQRHRLQRMYVVQFEADPDADPPIPPVPAPVVASLNTHDMPPFAAYWRAEDIDDQLALGLTDLTAARARKQARARLRRRIAAHLGLPASAAEPGGAGHALRALTTHLAASDGAALLVTLEDLWLENRPQNVPGTSAERPNWRRRLSRSIEELTRDTAVTAALEAVDRRRQEER
jgi:4-alpha-glucanotransferase